MYGECECFVMQMLYVCVLPCTHHTHPPHQYCRQPRTITLSQQTHMHHSHINHRIHIGYHNNLTYRLKTQTQHHTVGQHKLLIHDTHADIITIQETKLIPKANTPKVQFHHCACRQVAQGRRWAHYTH